MIKEYIENTRERTETVLFWPQMELNPKGAAMTKQNPEFVLFDPRTYVQYWFARNNITLPVLKKSDNLLRLMHLDYAQTIIKYKNQHQSKARGVSRVELEDAFIVHCDNLEKEFYKQEQDKLKCTGENLDQLRKFIKSVTGKEDALDIGVIAHWMWQVKRRGFNMPTVHTIMPILFGRQGGGKTVALNKLLQPLQAFRLNLKMNQLDDERFYHGFSTHLVALFDELQGIERTDMNALKNQLTTDENSYRELYTRVLKTVPMRCSFIGATNKHINESFSDSTGMRRFYELKALPNLDWEAINDLNYLQIWLGIDETRARGYLTKEMLKELATVQQQTVNQEDIEIFIDHYELVPTGDTKETSVRELYKVYQEWCRENGIHKPLPNSWFTRKLVNRGLQLIIIAGDKRFVISETSKVGTLPALALKSVLEFKK